MKDKQKTYKGFTLVELSIVLVIIGLIVGGVVGGQALISAAQVQGVVKDLNKYQTAMRTFELQYDAIPGDFAEATDYWSGSGVNSGNGDNLISGWWNEGYGVWRHLTEAEILPGYYSGGGSGGVRPGHNIPATSIDGGGIWINNSVDVYTYNTDDNHHPMQYGTIVFSGGNNRVNGGIVTATQAIAIDKKIDDGLADSGVLLATEHNGDTTGCVTGQRWASASAYVPSHAEASCKLTFKWDE